MRPRRWASKDDRDEAHQAHPEQVIRKLRDADSARSTFEVLTSSVLRVSVTVTSRCRSDFSRRSAKSSVTRCSGVSIRRPRILDTDAASLERRGTPPDGLWTRISLGLVATVEHDGGRHGGNPCRFEPRR